MELLTPNEAALMARRHPETITAALRDGELHGSQRKKNGRWLVQEDCLRAWSLGVACAHKVEVAAA